MYQIKCDGYILLDPRDDELVVDTPKVNLEVNTVGDLSFTIHKTHPYYERLKKLTSVFEVSDEFGVVFRGRMTNDDGDFHNSKLVDVEGAMAYFNDSTVRPYDFPGAFLEDEAYTQAATSGNVVAFFLGWLIDRHNEQVQEFQRFKLGKVTVSDPNNYITRSNTGYSTTWETLKEKLFNSSMGGYLCIRYESDGNYIDYLSEFDTANPQEITYGENLLDLSNKSDASETYSAIIPVGGKISKDGVGETMLTIADLPDGGITDDIVKSGDTLYSKSAVGKYGWICAPVDKTTWDDVTEAKNLQSKGVAFLESDGIMLSETVEVTAADLHFTDSQIRSFRIYRNVVVNSAVHGHNEAVFPLIKLGLDLQNPQNTKISVGSTRRTLTDINSQMGSDTANKIENIIVNIDEAKSEVSAVVGQVERQEERLSKLEVEADNISATVSEQTQTITQITGTVEGQGEQLAGLAENLADFSDTVTGSLEGLQAQIDGQIQTWFDSYIPTPDNAPASGWATEEEKINHLGDIFYIVDNQTMGGQAYRWAQVGGVYQWVLIEDVEVAKALADAARAQDTADGKRRVFVSQPVPPYDVGDLWAQGDGGDLMRCNTARESGAYVASDWGKASDYTNDNALHEFVEGEYAGTKESVDNQGQIIQTQESRLSDLEINTNAITATVQRVQTETQTSLEGVEQSLQDLSEQVSLSLTSDQVNIAIEKKLSEGVETVKTSTGFTFDDEGLTVRKTGSEMSTKVTEDGMEVSQNNTPVLAANSQGVEAKNLHASTYLIISGKARLEAYGTDRVACYWIGG